MLMTVTPDFSFLAKPGTILKKGDTYEATENKNGAVSGICENGEVLGVKPHEFKRIEEIKLKNNHISIKRVVELTEENTVCPMCGNKYIGESRSLSINNEIPGKEFVPFHLICECGYEVKVYE
jgi:predicted RNA-binding Zn-ribbon protein involved in translation (DUF1610 family)